MSRVATRPASADPSATAPASRFESRTWVCRKSPPETTRSPDVPLGIRRSATSALRWALPPCTLSLYCDANASRTIPASTAATAAMVSEPLRVPAKRRKACAWDRDLSVASIAIVEFSLSGQHRGAQVQRCGIARLPVVTDAGRGYVLDEVADEVARVVT